MKKCIDVICQLSSLCGKKRHASQWSLLLIMLMLSLPNYSHAWTLATRVMTTGGGLRVGSGALQTSLNGTIQKTYTTSQTVPVSLLPDTGYNVSGLTVNGTSWAAPYPSTVAMGLPSYPGKTSQSLSVSFAKKLISVTAAVETPGGSVSPSGTYSLMYTSNTSFTFTPLTGYSVYKIVGLPAGATLTSASTGAAVTLPYAGAVRASFAVPATPVNLSGAFVPLLVNAGIPKTILAGGSTTVQGSARAYDGSFASDLTFAWTLQSGPGAATISNADTSVATFTATTPGTYHLQLQVTDSMNATSTSTTYVIVTDSYPAAERFQCQDCHDSAGFVRTAFNDWSSSRHKAAGVVCAYCHVGTDTGNHPNLLHANTVDKSTFLFNTNITPPAGTGSFCLNGTCHSRGVTHKTDGMACGTCHTGGTHNTDGTFAPSQSCSTSTCHTTGSQCYQKDPNQCATCHTSAHGPNLLHHFAFANISTQKACTPFNVTITAQDVSNNTVTGFTGTAALTVSGNLSINPTSTGNFVAGVWSNPVKVWPAGTGVTITATRTGGAETGTSNPFTVTAPTSGYIFTWLPPVSLGHFEDNGEDNGKGKDKDKAFKAGCTIPVKFRLTDCSGTAVTSANPQLIVVKASDGAGAGDPIDIYGKANDDNLFRLAGDQYIYNLDTSGMEPGTYLIRAELEDGTHDEISFYLK